MVVDQAERPPFGTNLTYPVDRYVRLHHTSGSSGQRPLRWLDTAESWRWWRRLWATYVYGAAAVSPGDRVFMAFWYGTFIGFKSALGVAEEFGALVFPV